MDKRLERRTWRPDLNRNASSDRRQHLDLRFAVLRCHGICIRSTYAVIAFRFVIMARTLKDATFLTQPRRQSKMKSILRPAVDGGRGKSIREKCPSAGASMDEHSLRAGPAEPWYTNAGANEHANCRCFHGVPTPRHSQHTGLGKTEERAGPRQATVAHSD